MPAALPDLPSFWHVITRLGEAQIVLPPALLVALALARVPAARPGAIRWIVLVVAAALVTAASKVAFIGWGIGWGALDFTGISGHAMFAAAIYPPLFAILAGAAAPPAGRVAVGAACVLALLVGVSRLVLDVHTVSEVLAGWLVGGLVAIAALRGAAVAPWRIGAAIPIVAVLWFAFAPAQVPASRSHALVTRLALALSARSHPYTRHGMRVELLRRQGIPADAPGSGPARAD